MKYLLLTTCLLLGACGIRENLQAARAEGGDPFETISKFAITDLEVALRDAKSHNDTLAANCYSALIPVVENFGNRPEHEPIAGGFSGFQRARNLFAARQTGLPDTVRVACAPLVLDAQRTVLRLGIIAGGGGGALSILDRLRGIVD